QGTGTGSASPGQPAVLLAAPGTAGAHRGPHRKDLAGGIRRVLPQPSPRFPYRSLGAAPEPARHARIPGNPQDRTDADAGRRPGAPASLWRLQRESRVHRILARPGLASARAAGWTLAVLSALDAEEPRQVRRPSQFIGATPETLMPPHPPNFG